MKRFLSNIFSTIFACMALMFIMMNATSCANIIPPGGGPRDTIPPHLVLSLPRDSATQVHPSRITLTFDEFVEAKDVQQNLVVSPNPKNLPVVDYKLRNVTIKLKDSLQPNTTYSLNFGNSIRDVNEGNPAKNFTFVFSTGKKIDTKTFSGSVVLAETGKIDTTLIVALYKNLADTAVIKTTPMYYTFLDGKGNFKFRFLPEGNYAAYVLPNDYVKKYDDSTKLFAFLDSTVHISDSSKPVLFYAYEEAKKKTKSTTAPTAPVKAKNIKEDKRLRFHTDFDNGKQDLLSKYLALTFNRKVEKIDSSMIALCDTNYHPVKGYTLQLDSTAHKLLISYPWKEDVAFKLIVQKEAATDSAGVTLFKTDTVSFYTKKEADYGSLKIRFTNLDVSRHPVLELIQDDKIVFSHRMTQKTFYQKLYYPGDYEIRVLYDDNQNGIWDPGNFKLKKQPEQVKSIEKKINIRNNWDNEYELRL
ncbi:MAG: Ig-like domain-containing protein [Bacteroidota bacterium]|nr:Ig-like domain-containing protein [Bacteroidota bacterium]